MIGAAPMSTGAIDVLQTIVIVVLALMVWHLTEERR